MQTKIYFANNVPAALEVARQELGPDALLVDSRPAPDHARKFGRLEVTFAWDPAGPPKPPVPSAPVPISRSAPARGGSELDEIRQQIAALRAAVDLPPADDGFVFDRLRDAGMSVELAREISGEVPRSSADPQGAVVRALAGRMAVTPFAAMTPGESRTLAFIGAPGRGKTTSLVKVAVGLGLARKIPVRIYGVGAHGVGGQEQLARYAAILGVPHQSYESLENLNLALNGDAWRGLALIDTPGIAPSDRNELRDFGRFFSARPEIETHLVLRADARCADMLHVISRLAVMKPSHLLFTGLDEATGTGAIVETLIKGGIPGMFAGTGQQIPEDLEELDPERLAREVWAGTWINARSGSHGESRVAVAA